MLSLVIPLNTSIRQRNAFLEEVRAQNFPPKPLQVVFVSNQQDLLRSYPQVPFSVLSIHVHGKNISGWKDQAAREASGEIVYFLSDDVIFDNSEDLLRIYEYFLENSNVTVAVGYDVFHKLIGNEKSPAPQIYSSEILPQSGEANICVRREVIESGFLFSGLVLGENPIEELKMIGHSPEKLKWLQLHHKKHLPVLFVYFLKAWDAFLRPILQKTVQGLDDFYNSERTQKFLSKSQVVALQMARWLNRQAQQLSPALASKTIQLFRLLEKWYLSRKATQKHRKPELREDKKFFVPHLTSDDRGEDSRAPRFVLKSRSEKDLNP